VAHGDGCSTLLDPGPRVSCGEQSGECFVAFDDEKIAGIVCGAGCPRIGYVCRQDYLPSLDRRHMLAQRGIFNSIRINDLIFMKAHFDVSTLVFGEGMGSYING